MAKTFNRRPFSVSTPSSKEANNHFFNHINWKGMASDKNFLAADQETFEDCNNVYMDSEGLLRSRPSVKLKSSLVNITKFWNFDDVNVYCAKDGAKYKLSFTDLDFRPIAAIDNLKSDNVKPVLKDSKIFIFTDSQIFSYFDINTKSVSDASNYIYIPVVDNEGKGESNNFLSDSVLKTYLYADDLSIDSEMDGKELSYELDDSTINITFNKDTARRFIVDKFPIGLPDGTDYIIASYALGTPLYVACGLNIGTSNSYLTKVCVNAGSGWETRMEGMNIAFNNVFDSPCSLNDTQFGVSDDASLFYICANDGLYFLSTIKNETGVYEYSSLTKVVDVNVQSQIYAKVVSVSNYIVSYIDASYSYFRGVLNGKALDLSFHTGPNILRTFGAYYDSVFGGFKAYTVYSLSGTQTVYSYEILDSVKSSRITSSATLDFLAIKGDYCIYAKRLKYEENGELKDSEFMAISRLRLDTKKSVAMLYLKQEEFDSRYGIYGRLSDDGLSFYYLNKCWFYADRNENFTYNAVDTGINTITHNFGNYSAYSQAGTNVVYTSKVSRIITLKTTTATNVNYAAIGQLSKSRWSELDSFYVGNSKDLYVSELRKNKNGEFLWYFPEVNEQKFSDVITGLQPISSSEMAIFTPDEVWYGSYDKETGYYYYYKSKLQVGLAEGSDVMTSYDGTKIVFPSQRGIVALSYQDFVASSDQILTYVSDNIFDKIKSFVSSPVRLLRYQHWILVYRTDVEYGYLYDVRNGSWWPLSLTKGMIPTEFFVVENEVLLLIDGKLFKLDKSDNDYYDYDGNIHNIDWHLTSQKLHFNAVNYVKHINNLTFYTVLDSDKSVNFKMDVKNYRKRISKSEVQTVSYRVDVIRTVVKKVNYFKVDEFQYTIRHDDEQAIRIPLSLSGVTIKYSVGGQVR